jgi:hypothetical protein
VDGTALLRYLTLPFTVAPLLLVTIFAVLLQLGLHADLLGLPLLYIVGSWFLKYAFVLLEHTAQGRPGAPVFSMEDANPLGEMRPFQFGLLIATFYGLGRALGSVLGDGWATTACVLGMVILPAVVAIEAVTGSFVAALQPAGVAAMIRRLGPGYLVVMAIAAACGWLAQWIALDATHLALLLRIALLMLLWLVLFSTLGGVIHERRFEIGFEPERSPETTQRRQVAALQRERDRFVDQVFAEYRAGSPVNAWASIQQRAGQGEGALTEYEWLYPRVAAWENPALANRVAQELLTRLLTSQRNGDAVKLVQDRLRADARFRPATGEQTLRVAQLARDSGDWPLARALIADFEQRFADHPVRGSVALLAEQLHKR